MYYNIFIFNIMDIFFNKNEYILKFIQEITKEFKYTKEEKIIIEKLMNKLKKNMIRFLIM